MKIFCKNWTGLLWTLCVLFFLTGCSSVVDSDGETVLYPDKNRTIVYKLFPNDMAKNDSAAAALAHGIMLVVHPNASYQLSFDIDPTHPAPELQLFRSYSINETEGLIGFRKVRTLTPTVVGNRYVYTFNCEENKMSTWFTSLGVDGQYYEGNVKNISFTGIGAYGDHFSINLIVVGSMTNTEDGLDIEQLSRYMLNLFRKKYYGVTIDTIYVRYAHEHPTLGKNYPSNQPWVAGLSSEDVFVSELAGWPEDNLRNALSIVLVHSINNDNVMGYSHLFAGALGAGKESSVVIGENVRKPNHEIELLSSRTIAITAVHETGHFFGLRHTSTTRRDLSQYAKDNNNKEIPVGDWSNIEDGLTDTPFCAYILSCGLYKKAEEQSNPKYPAGIYAEGAASLAKEGVYSCPDVDNIMFPVTVDDNDYATFTNQQMELVRSSLMIYPH